MSCFILFPPEGNFDTDAWDGDGWGNPTNLKNIHKKRRISQKYILTKNRLYYIYIYILYIIFLKNI